MAETPAALETLDLSEKNFKKLPKPTPDESLASTLILDDNDLQRIEGIDSFSKVQKLSAVRNQLLRMYGVCRLYNLHSLNLAHNGILTIEGLKDLVQLKYLNLAGNSIKTIEHLNTNLSLEHLDLSENAITHITDLSYLKSLKELQLHNNKISHLRQCERFIPASLTTLTLANNIIVDLNEIGQLAHLTNLNSISIANNPCVNMTGQKIGFDYRPFVINWCLSVQVIDGYVVDAIESLRGEWLYSQGRGRHFRIGDHQELAQYLASVCPLSGEQQLETEEDRKLRLILSKAQHHQQQLREQGNSPIPSPSVRKKFQAAKSSPRLQSARINNTRSPDKMTSSCYNAAMISSQMGIDSGIGSIMSQSLDPSILSQTSKDDINAKLNSHSMSVTKENGFCLDDYEVVNSPLQALSKLVPVPESLMSPDYRPSSLSSRLNLMSTIPTPTVSQKPTPRMPQPAAAPAVNKSPKMARSSNIAKPKSTFNLETKRTNSPSPVRSRRGIPVNSVKTTGSPPLPAKPLVSAMKKSPSTDDESEICDAKLQTIQMKAEEKRMQKDAEVSSNSSSNEEKAEMAATFIQKMWRGYYTRHRDKQTVDKYKSLQSQRADEYLQKLACDMESTKAALESERKIQMLQMQAINALWKKVSALQPEDCNNQATTSVVATNNALAGNNNLESVDIVNTLAATCSSLQNQVQQLQGSMQDMVKFMGLFAQMPQINNQLQGKDNVIATQTEIIAVHTPQGEAAKGFPFHKQLRPSSLPLPVGTRTPKRDAATTITTSSSTSSTSTVEAELRQFAGSLVDGVIRTVSEGHDDCLGLQQSTEITVTDTDKYNTIF